MNNSFFGSIGDDEDDRKKPWNDSQFKIQTTCNEIIHPAVPKSDYISRLFDSSKSSKKNEFTTFLKQTQSYEVDHESDPEQKPEEEEEKEIKDDIYEADEIGEGEENESLFEYDEAECKSDDFCFEVRKPKNEQSAFVSLPNPNTPQLIPPLTVPQVLNPVKEESPEKEKSEITDSAQSQTTKRKDVCIKSILRSMRRYYCNILESSTSYLRKEKKIKHKHQNLIRCAQIIVSQIGINDFSPNMAFYFCLFSYSCDMRKILEKLKVNHQYLKNPCTCDKPIDECVCSNYNVDPSNINRGIQIINLIENALNKFSKKIFNKLIEIPEIAYLVQHFLNNKQDSIENIKEFEECCMILDEKSKSVIAKYNQANLKVGTPAAILPKDESLRVKCKEEFYISEPFFKTPSNK